jgi:hypothetical protein
MKTMREQLKRGRPHKFGRPSQLVTVTLPNDVVRQLRSIDRDLARAIVGMITSIGQADDGPPDTQLVAIGDRQSLIVVNHTVIRSLPGINIVSLDGRRSFLALSPGQGASDLELAVIDRLDETLDMRERQALEQLRQNLKAWRRDALLRFHARSIIVVETLADTRRRNRAAVAPVFGKKQGTTLRPRARELPRSR